MAVRLGTTRPYRLRYAHPETGPAINKVADRAALPAIRPCPDSSQPREARSTSMEMEYKDTNRRGKFVVIVGVVLAIVAGGAAFYLIQQAQQTAGQGEAQLVNVVVAAQVIPARTPIQPGAVEVRKVPLDTVTQVGIVTDPSQLTGNVLAISVAIG